MGIGSLLLRTSYRFRVAKTLAIAELCATTELYFRLLDWA